MTQSPSGKLEYREIEGFPVFYFSSYFDETVGKELHTYVDDLLAAGKIHMILDFSNCKVVNSLGVAQILDLTVKVAEDLHGTLMFTGVRPIVARVFSLSGMVPPAEIVENVEKAIILLKA